MSLTPSHEPATETARGGSASKAAVTLQGLEETFGKWWKIEEACGGWYAVRRHSVSEVNIGRGMSNVRCGQTLAELAGHLAEEKRTETRCQLLRGHR